MADGQQGGEQAFFVDNGSLSRVGGLGWHPEGLECRDYGNHVHPKSRPPIIVWAPRAGIAREDMPVGTMIRPGVYADRVPDPHPVERWEVRVSHHRKDGSVASQVATLYEHERAFPLTPWMRVRNAAGVLVGQIANAESRGG